MSSNADYHSFLICFHPGHSDVFRNGLPLGVIKGNEFVRHKTTMPDGREFVTAYPETLPALVKEVCEMMEEVKP